MATGPGLPGWSIPSQKRLNGAILETLSGPEELGIMQRRRVPFGKSTEEALDDAPIPLIAADLTLPPGLE